MYKYGEEILVRCWECEEWEKRIFVHFAQNGAVVCVNKLYEKKFESEEPFFGTVVFLHHKSLPKEYNPAEMIGRKVRGKYSGNHFLILMATNDGIYVPSLNSKDKLDFYHSENFNEFLELVD